MKRDIVTVERFYTAHADELQLKLVAGATGLNRIIREPTVNRPGLLLTGFTRYFAGRRIQVVGYAESYYLKSLSPEKRLQSYKMLFSHKIPCIVFCRTLRPDKQFLRMAEKFEVPVFECPLITMKFINRATLALETLFAPYGIEMGSMVDILGVGVIIRGESGIGKSESVLGLIERGYSLVADDVTKVTLVDGREVVGTSADVTRDHMEVRGIGIINVAALFGVRSVSTKKKVDLVVTLMPWEQVRQADRLGMEERYTKILGVNIPHVVIPVRPGRDLARLIEVAAFHQKLKASGQNPAREVSDRLLAKIKAKELP